MFSSIILSGHIRQLPLNMWEPSFINTYVVYISLIWCHINKFYDATAPHHRILLRQHTISTNNYHTNTSATSISDG